MTRFGAGSLTPKGYGRPRTPYLVTWIGPWPLKPSLRAVADVRSYSRPPTYGPRSITRTRRTRPWWRSVTFVPQGSDLLATPTEPVVSVPPHPSLLPKRPGPYHDASAWR